MMMIFSPQKRNQQRHGTFFVTVLNIVPAPRFIPEGVVNYLYWPVPS